MKLRNPPIETIRAILIRFIGERNLFFVEFIPNVDSNGGLGGIVGCEEGGEGVGAFVGDGGFAGG